MKSLHISAFFFPENFFPEAVCNFFITTALWGILYLGYITAIYHILYSKKGVMSIKKHCKKVITVAGT